jgi:hypothetical protein
LLIVDWGLLIESETRGKRHRCSGDGGSSAAKRFLATGSELSSSIGVQNRHFRSPSFFAAIASAAANPFSIAVKCTNSHIDSNVAKQDEKTPVAEACVRNPF